eukprot:4025233-Pyramimonas_sp.AAC.1
MLVLFEEEKGRGRESTLATVETPATARRVDGPEQAGPRSAHDVISACNGGAGSAMLGRKTQDRELRRGEIAPARRADFRGAIEKEWDSWLRYKYAAVLEPD